MRELLNHLLAVTKLGPQLRRAARMALARDDEHRMRQVGRIIVGELMRRGELSRVLISGREERDDAVFALRGQDHLLDLSVFYAEPAPEETAGGATAVPDPDDDPLAGVDLSAQERLLRAMESAQSLPVPQPGNGGDAIILQSVLDLLHPFIPGSTLFIELFSGDFPAEEVPSLFHLPTESRPLWGTTRVTGEAVWIPARSELPAPLRARFDDPDGEAAAGLPPFACGIAVPLYSPDQAEVPEAGESREAGLLYILSERAAARDDMVKLGIRLSRFVTSGWRQRRRMGHLVHTDNLTGVRNRGFFDDQFGLEVERARRHESSLVLLIGDIDHFKRVNDNYGHQMGDRVLKTVAREMLQGLRRIDLVCRVGGEEFALVLPDTGLDAAMEVASRIQVRIGNLRLTDPAHAEPIRITISFGGVAFPEGGDTPEVLYGRADEMLYLSKERGRNRCHFWNPDGEPLLILPDYRDS